MEMKLGMQFNFDISTLVKNQAHERNHAEESRNKNLSEERPAQRGAFEEHQGAFDERRLVFEKRVRRLH